VRFEHPAALIALAALVPAAVFSTRRFKRRSRAFFSLAGTLNRGGALSESELRFRANGATACFISSLACAIIALAGPSWGNRLVPEYRRGLDVVLALDISRSMDAKDLSPSRLRRAAAVARTFVESSPGTRFSVVLGKGDGVVAIPLTDDSESVLTLLAALSSDSMTSRGTDLERLIDAAMKAFPSSSSARRLVVLFSDGEGLSGDASGATARAADKGVLLATVGFGTVQGAPVPLGKDNFVRGADGAPVRSSLKEDRLRAEAQRTGGPYVDGSRGDAGSALATFAAGLSSVAAADGFRREPLPRYRVFLSAALLLLLASKAAETIPRRRLR
jgi:Ca-activated chloride channel family protein